MRISDWSSDVCSSDLLFAILGQTVVADHACTIAQRGRLLGGGRIIGHDDGGGYAQKLRSQCNGLGMITRRKRHHPCLPLGRRPIGHGVITATKLAGSDALTVLALEYTIGSASCRERECQSG